MPVQAKKVGTIKNLKRSLSKGAGGYLKRIPADGIVVRFMTEPNEFIEYKEHYNENSDPRYFPCADECPECAEGRTSGSIRYLANVVDTTESRVEALVMPKSVVSELMRMYEKYGTIMDRAYELSKTGTTKNDTEYHVDKEDRSKFNMKPYEQIDLLAKLNSQLAPPEDDDDDEDEEEPPRRVVKKAIKKAPVRAAGSSSGSGLSKPVKRAVKKAPAKKLIRR
jgi:hypothetical protein